MSYWDRLLCPAPETTPWPQGLSNAKKTPSSSSSFYAAGAAAAAAASGGGGGAFARLPTVVSRLHTSTPRASGASGSSTGTLSLKTRPWSEHNNHSGWASAQLSVSPPPSAGRSGEIDDDLSGPHHHHAVTGGCWIDRRKRASLATSEGVEGRRKRTSSHESFVLDSRMKDIERGFGAPVVLDDDAAQQQHGGGGGGGWRTVDGSTAEELPHTNSGGHGNTAAARSREAAARADKSRTKGSLRSGIMSGISLTSPPSTALEQGRGGLINLTSPFVASPAGPEPRRNARRFSESAFSTSSTQEHAVFARSHSLPSIDAAVSSSSARTLAREGVVSAPGQGGGGRCCATEQGFDETAGNASLGTAPCEQRGGRRVGGAAKSPPGRSVSGDRGLVTASAAAAAAEEDRPPKAFHNFVFRRNRRDTPKHSSSSSSRESGGSECVTCPSQGNAVGEPGTRRGVSGSAGGNGNPGAVESLASRSRREWESAQGRRLRQTGRTQAAHPGTPSEAFSILSFGGGRKLGCCRGGADRVLKCQRCGSARIRLFAPTLAAGDDDPADKKRPSVGDSVGGGNQSSLVPTSWGMGDTAEQLGRRPRERTGPGRTALPARGDASGSKGSGSSSRLDGISRESGQAVSSGGGGGNWNKGWRFRGDECRPGPAAPGSSLLVPSRRS